MVQSTFMVSDVRRMILSAGQLLEAGINVYSMKDRDKRCLEFSDKARASMEVRGKSFYIRGRVMVSSAVHQAFVAPVDVDMGDKKAAEVAAGTAPTAGAAPKAGSTPTAGATPTARSAPTANAAPTASASSSTAPAHSATSTAAATTAVAAWPGDRIIGPDSPVDQLRARLRELRSAM